MAECLKSLSTFKSKAKFHNNKHATVSKKNINKNILWTCFILNLVGFVIVTHIHMLTFFLSQINFSREKMHCKTHSRFKNCNV